MLSYFELEYRITEPESTAHSNWLSAVADKRVRAAVLAVASRAGKEVTPAQRERAIAEAAAAAAAVSCLPSANLVAKELYILSQEAFQTCECA